MSFKDKVVNWTRLGLKGLAFLFIFDKYVLPNHKVKESVEGLEQPRLNLADHEMADLLYPKTG